jgi:hypothetical protein
MTLTDALPADPSSPIPPALTQLTHAEPFQDGDHPDLLAYLATVPDPRAARGRRHPLIAILGLAAAAVLAGARSVTAIAEWPPMRPSRSEPRWVSAAAPLATSPSPPRPPSVGPWRAWTLGPSPAPSAPGSPTATAAVGPGSGLHGHPGLAARQAAQAHHVAGEQRHPVGAPWSIWALLACGTVAPAAAGAAARLVGAQRQQGPAPRRPVARCHGGGDDPTIRTGRMVRQGCGPHRTPHISRASGRTRGVGAGQDYGRTPRRSVQAAAS